MKSLLAAGMTCFIACSTYAYDFRNGNTVVINKPVYENLYIAAGTVYINAPVYGDLVVAGGYIHINDTVQNDILVAGGDITFNGYVGGDIRCAGGSLYIMKNVQGEVILSGGRASIDKKVTIGSLLASGGNMTVDGTVNGLVKGTFGKLIFNGIAMKDLDCKGGKLSINGIVYGKSSLAASNEILIGNEAIFNNPIHYWTPDKQINFKQSLKNIHTIYDPALQLNVGRWYFLGFTSVAGLLWYVGMIITLIMILQYLFSSTMKKAGETEYDHALKSFLYGLLFFIGIPVAAVIIFITVVGVPAALILLVSYIILTLLSIVITSVVAANWLRSRSYENWKFMRMVMTAFGIFVVLKIVSLTPFFGWAIVGILICIAYGAILLSISWKRQFRI